MLRKANGSAAADPAADMGIAGAAGATGGGDRSGADAGDAAGAAGSAGAGSVRVMACCEMLLKPRPIWCINKQ